MKPDVLTYRMETLGCKVNEYESQYYASQLEKAGWKPVAPGEQADLVVVNTCTVTNTAAAKSRQRLHKMKKENPQARLVLVGCYAQSLSEEQRKNLGVDLIIGARHKKELAQLAAGLMGDHSLVDVVEDASQPQEFEAMPIERFARQHRAFLKIEDGCNQFCSYCAIPLVRGRERFLPFEQAITQAQALAKAGHEEIVLTGIHTGRYFSQGLKLADLLKALLENTPKNVKYRISSIEITEVDEDLIEVLAKSPRLLKHLHIPIQAGSDATLARMKRPYTVAQFQEHLEHMRQMVPELSVSTDVIAGFVQESEEEFEETCRTLEQCRFSFLHVFPYSRRDDTKAAAMSGHLDPALIKERARKLLKLSEKLRQKDMERFDQLEVYMERSRKGGYMGYTSQYHPIWIESDLPLQGRLTTGYDSIVNGTYIVKKKGQRS